MDEFNKNENESNDVIQNASKHYILGTLGALIGAVIASIPWILMYVYGKMILSALAIIIAIGALKGYQIFKGTIDKKLPFIITIISLLVIVVTTLAVIPMLLLIKDGYEPTIANFQLLYGMDTFKSAIIHDFIISVAFTILGISGVIVNINKQIKNSDKPLNEIKISSTLENPDTPANQEQVVGSVKAEKSVGHRFASLFGKIILVIIIVAAVFVALVALDDDSTNSNSTSNNQVSSQTTKNTTKYDLPDFGIQVRVPVNMVFTNSSKELDYLFGDGSNEIYEFALYNQTDLVSCFITDFTDKELDNYYESLKKSFATGKMVSELKKETISGFEFTTIEAQFSSNDTTYNDLCLGYYANGKFILFEYTCPTENANQARNIMGNIIKKLK